MINDTIADMLTRLRNAQLANKTSVALRATRVTRNIAQLLFQEGFLSNIEPETNGMFEVTLKRSVKTFKRISTPGGSCICEPQRTSTCFKWNGNCYYFNISRNYD